MKLYRVSKFGTPTKRLALAIFGLLSAAPFSLHAQDEPRGYWATTKQVEVRCPDGEIAGMIAPETVVRVIGTGDEGWFNVQGFSFEDNPCAEQYIAAKDLQPVEFEFWKLNEGWQDGLDVDGKHYNAGAVFQVLTKDQTARALTIVGPRGTPEFLTITTDLANEEFFTLKWDTKTTAPSCPIPESVKGLAAVPLTFFSFATTWQGVLVVGFFLLITHVLNAVGLRGGVHWPWLFSLVFSALFFCGFGWSFLHYEDEWEKCEAQRASLRSLTTPNGFILPTEDARRIYPEPVKSFVQNFILNKGGLEGQACFLLLALPCYLGLCIRGVFNLYSIATYKPPQGEPVYDREAGGLPSVVRQETVMEFEAPKIQHRRWFFWIARRDRAFINLHTKAIQAAIKNLKLQIEFIKLRDEAKHLEFTLATHQIQRETERQRAETAKQTEKINHSTVILQGKKRNTGFAADLVEERQRLHRTKNPPTPEDPAARYLREAQQDYNERYGRRRAGWEVARREKDSRYARSGGNLSEDDERENMNTDDWAQGWTDRW